MKRWRVRVCVADHGRCAEVRVFPSRWTWQDYNGVLVARVVLTADDAEAQISDARVQAQSAAEAFRHLEALA